MSPAPPSHPPPEDLELAARLAMEAARRPPRSVTPILGRGVVNWVLVAEAGDMALVVRLARDGDDGAALAAYRKEAWCLERAAEIGLPGPRPLSVGEFEGRAYIVQTYVPGESGAGVPMDVLGVWKELGGYARRVARVPARGFGLVLADPGHGLFTDPFHSSFRDQIEFNLDRLEPRDPLLALGVYELGHQPAIRNHLREMLAEEWPLALCHGDLVPGNTIIDGAGDVFLLDWGQAGVDVYPESVAAEARRLLYLGKVTPAEVGWLLDGMESADSASPRFRSRVERLMLLKALDRLRWALERRADRVEELAAEAHQLWHGLRLGAHGG